MYLFHTPFMFCLNLFLNSIDLTTGLSASKYEAPTDIQRESIGLALNGNDILGAAKTGSGKTLAFIIPVRLSLLDMLRKLSA